MTHPPDHPLAPPVPSPWFTWHAHRLARGARVLDLAAGTGRHALAAARLGCAVTAAERDPAALALARTLAEREGLAIDWWAADLEAAWPDWGVFDAVLVFNYLDRDRMDRVRAAVAPGGWLLMETFLAAQREQGWGPTRDDHLLAPFELPRLAEGLVVVHGREALEATPDGRVRAVASLCARRPA